MTQQLALNFDTAPRARRTDPASSHAAAAELQASGAMNWQRAQVLIVVEQYGPGTARELAQRSGMDRYKISRRCSELRALGLIVQGPIRQCTAGGRPSVEWSLPLTEGQR